jgi:hypothetical protein
MDCRASGERFVTLLRKNQLLGCNPEPDESRTHHNTLRSNLISLPHLHLDSQVVVSLYAL